MKWWIIGFCSHISKMYANNGTNSWYSEMLNTIDHLRHYAGMAWPIVLRRYTPTERLESNYPNLTWWRTEDLGHFEWKWLANWLDKNNIVYVKSGRRIGCSQSDSILIAMNLDDGILMV